jgi:hypothetical protein
MNIVNFINKLADKLISWPDNKNSGPLPEEPLKLPMPLPSPHLTDAEKHVVEKLAEAWNLYNQLPEQHPSDKLEFMHGLHDLQRIVMYRPAFRQINLIREQ